MKVKVLRDKCISVAACVAVAPEVFQLDDEGLAYVKDENGASAEIILQAAKSCPVDAIEVYDDAGKKLWPEN